MTDVLHQKRFPTVGPHMMWLLAAFLIAVKLVLTSFQLMIASPDLSPIDDTLMFQLARNITAGQWLGEYNWLTLSKHSFFALWLAVVHMLGVNFLVAGQALYAAACALLLSAIRPLVKSCAARLCVFAAVLYTPATWSACTLRVYRDNIYHSLVLIAFAGLLGAFCRYRESIWKCIGYYLAAGAAMAAAWLSHEDNALLLPFVFCAAAVYLVAVFRSRDVHGKAAKAAMLLLPVAVFAAGVGAWCAMNLQHYGRFIISDYTSSEFCDAMGALTRVYPDDQDRYVLVPHSTREALYEVSPSLATLEPYLEEEMMYNNYGSVPDKEFNSGGIHWALREAADKAGYYETAETARAFWQAVADEINQACDDGLIPCEGRHSGVMSPVRLRYVPATFEKFLQTLKMLVLFEQTEPVQVLSIATPEQSAEWESYLHCTSTKAAKAGTSEPYFSPLQELAYLCLNILTWIARILVWPMMALTVVWIVRYVRLCIRGARGGSLPQDLAGCILAAGFFLTGLLRIAAVSYIFAVSFSIPPYLMYLLPVCPLLVFFLAFGSVKFFELRRAG